MLFSFFDQIAPILHPFSYNLAREIVRESETTDVLGWCYVEFLIGLLETHILTPKIDSVSSRRVQIWKGDRNIYWLNRNCFLRLAETNYSKRPNLQISGRISVIRTSKWAEHTDLNQALPAPKTGQCESYSFRGLLYKIMRCIITCMTCGTRFCGKWQ